MSARRPTLKLGLRDLALPGVDDLQGGVARRRAAVERATTDMSAAEAAYVQAARGRNLTWREIGERVGVTAQAAWETFHAAAQAAGVSRRASMNDVAAIASVTRRTVYRVLSEPQLVADATRQKVLAAMGTVGYERPDDGGSQVGPSSGDGPLSLFNGVVAVASAVDRLRLHAHH